MLSGKNSWTPVKRDFGTQVRLLPSAAISIMSLHSPCSLGGIHAQMKFCFGGSFMDIFLRRKNEKAVFYRKSPSSKRARGRI